MSESLIDPKNSVDACSSNWKLTPEQQGHFDRLCQLMNEAGSDPVDDALVSSSRLRKPEPAVVNVVEPIETEPATRQPRSRIAHVLGAIGLAH